MAATLIDPIALTPGSAESFREALNDNFENMKANASAVNADIDYLRNNELKEVAFTASASAITTDPSHRFATDTDIENWGKRLTISSSGISPAITYSVIQDGSDITSELQALFSTGAWKPTKTSQLINDSGFIAGPSISSSEVVYIENVTATEVSGGTPLTSEFTRQWAIPCVDNSHYCTPDMVPTVVFNQDDSMSGDWAQVCQAGDGEIYIWSKEDTPTHSVTAANLKAVYAVTPTLIIPQPEE